MSSTASVIGHGGDQVGGFQEMEGRMREQIRVLQEQRAAAMMTEIVDLQRERDMAVGKLKRMEKSVTGDGKGRRGERRRRRRREWGRKGERGEREEEGVGEEGERGGGGLEEE